MKSETSVASGPAQARRVTACAGVILATLLGTTGSSWAQTSDAFYTYSGSAPLSSYAPGTVLATRTISYQMAGIPTPLTVVQLLYRSQSALGVPTANVTSVIEPPLSIGPAQAVFSYQSFYDSLNVDDSPSRQFASGSDAADEAEESAMYLPDLLAGYPVVVADIEGPDAEYGPDAGVAYGYYTLDSLRAVLNSPATNISPSAKIALFGYSGGATGTEFAAELAPSYAPDVNGHLVGAAMGGVGVDPYHLLQYIDGSSVYSAALPLLLISITRAYGVDFTPYLSPYGAYVVQEMANENLSQAEAMAPVVWASLFQPQYAAYNAIPQVVSILNSSTMGTHGTPTIPLFIVEGNDGILEGTQPSAIYGSGDGVMVTGDIRALALQYCAAKVDVGYVESELTSHLTTLPLWLPAAQAWMLGRIAGAPASNNCSAIAPGNSLAPATPAS